MAGTTLTARRAPPTVAGMTHPGRALTAALVVAGSVGCASYGYNYPDPWGPRCAGRFAEPRTAAPGPVKIASFNIKFASDVERALGTLERGGLDDADVLLLQEMDLPGSERVARALGMDFVYYPAAVHPASGRQFGLAILSPWPIRRDRKIPLPSLSGSDDAQKIAVAAEVWVRGVPFGVVNVHLQSGLSPVQVGDQIQVLTGCVFGSRCRVAGAPLLPDLDYYVVGGDFNTRGEAHIEVARDLLAVAGLQQVPGIGRTHKYLTDSLGRVDHLFVSPTLEVEESGHVKGFFFTGSDHRPIFATVAMTGAGTGADGRRPSETWPTTPAHADQCLCEGVDCHPVATGR